MEYDFLIRIERKTPRLDKQGKVVFGTAYPIAKDLVLTARHVLADSGATIDLSKIDLAWFYFSEVDGKRVRCDLTDAQIVWDGAKFPRERDQLGWDIAILKCPFPACISVPRNLIHFGKPKNDVRWQSRGFAETGQSNDRRDPQPLKGGMYGCSDKDEIFQLSVEDPARIPEGWKGASGAPVFADGRIIGVITKALVKYDARIEAVPMFRLLQLPGFRGAVGLNHYPPTEIDNSRFKKNIVALLSKHSSLLDLLDDARTRKVFNGKEIGMPCGHNDVKSRAARLADCMFEDFESGSLLLSFAMHECMASNDEDAKGLLHRIVYFYFPACFTLDESGAVLADFMHGLSDLVDARAATLASVEARRAAMEERPMAFDLDQTRVDGPVGRNKLANPPPTALEDIKNGKSEEYLDRLLYEKTSSRAGYANKDYAAFREQINQAMEIGHTAGGSPYFVLNDQLNKGDAKFVKDEMNQLSQKYRSQYTNLFITFLNEDAELNLREREHLDWFWKTFLEG